MARKRQAFIGSVFGKLTILGDAPDSKCGQRMVYTNCDCGNIKEQALCHLKSGHTSSCGCFHPQKMSEIKKSHGESNSRLYSIWHGVLRRCTDINHKQYPNYGKRGITICSSWTSDINTFIHWAKTNGYREDLTLDRIDNNRGYFPDNCRWANTTIQARNKQKRKSIRGKNTSSQYIGVHFFKRDATYRASIKINKRLVHLGYFQTELEAAKVRDHYILDNALEGFTLSKVI
jgi:hypothetical protein